VKMAYPFAPRRLWILRWAGSCAWDHSHGEPVLLILEKGLLFGG
jgi:hypothetical protein